MAASPRRVEHLALEGRRLPRPPPEQHDLLGLEQRHARAGLDQLPHGALLVEHVRHPHPVERALAHAGGHVEVRVRVEVEEPDVPARADVPGDRPDPDGAVAAEDERRLARGDRRPTRRAVSRTTSTTVAAFCARGCSRSGRQRQTGRSPWSRTLDAGPAQHLEQPGRPQRRGRLLLAGSERARARRHPDHAERATHVRCGPMSATRTCVALPSLTFHVHTARRPAGSPSRRASTCPITITEPGIARKSVGVDRQLVPSPLDVGEVLAHPVVPAVGLRAADRGGRAPEVELAVLRQVGQRGVDVARVEGVVDRAHDRDVLRPSGRVPVVVRARHPPRD